jgi:hypothetical protein
MDWLVVGRTEEYVLDKTENAGGRSKDITFIGRFNAVLFNFGVP